MFQWDMQKILKILKKDDENQGVLKTGDLATKR